MLLCLQSPSTLATVRVVHFFPQFHGFVVYFFMVLICISLITMSLEVRYLFIHLLVICTFYSVNSCSSPFPIFLLVVVIFFLIYTNSYIFWILMLCQLEMLQILSFTSWLAVTFYVVLRHRKFKC